MAYAKRFALKMTKVRDELETTVIYFHMSAVSSLKVVFVRGQNCKKAVHASLPAVADDAGENGKLRIGLYRRITPIDNTIQ